MSAHIPKVSKGFEVTSDSPCSCGNWSRGGDFCDLYFLSSVKLFNQCQNRIFCCTSKKKIREIFECSLSLLSQAFNSFGFHLEIKKAWAALLPKLLSKFVSSYIILTWYFLEFPKVAATFVAGCVWNGCMEENLETQGRMEKYMYICTFCITEVIYSVLLHVN